MKSTEKKLVRKKGYVYSSGRVYSDKAYKNMMDYRQDYIKETYRRFNVRFRKDEEANIIEWLEAQDSFTDYIRNLILEDMERQAKKKRK